MHRRLKLNASVADVFDGASGGGRGASRGQWWQLLEKVGHHLRMGQKALKLVRRDLGRAPGEGKSMFGRSSVPS